MEKPIQVQESIEALERLRLYHLAEADRCAEMIRQLQESAPPSTRRFTAVKRTFEDSILLLLDGNIPRTSTWLMTHYNRMAGEGLTIQDFSPRISQLVRKGALKVQKFPENPQGKKQYYGLPDWFARGKLKPEYLQRLE
jgi:hypothetical protein